MKHYASGPEAERAGLKVVYFGNSQGVFSNRYFQALMATPGAIAAVVDTPAAKRKSTNTRPLNGVVPFTEAAQARKIPVFAPDKPNDPEFVQTLARLAPDLFLAAGYMNLLKPPLLAVPRRLAANFHASLLPAYRGKHPLFWALRNAERWVGLTVHVMDAGLDTGDILYQVRVRTRKQDSVETVYERIMERSAALVSRLLADLAKGTLRRRPQGTAGGSCYSSVTENDFRLNWTDDAQRLQRWICASPGQCFCEIAAGQRIFLMDAKAVPQARGARPGRIMKLGGSAGTIAARRGSLRVRRVRCPGGDVVSMAAFLRDRGLKKGDLMR